MENLEEIIINEINKKGPITFERFMDFALYHDQLGYYPSGKVKIGKEGDFYTSPHVHSAFGQVISNFIMRALDFIPSGNFTILEMGAGKGYLAFDILNHFEKFPDIYEHLTYLIIEKRSSNFVEDLGKYKKKIKILNNLNELNNNINGVILTNEFFDSLPFHRLIYSEGSFNEFFVDYWSGMFHEITKELLNQEIIDYLDRYQLQLTDTKQLEVNLNASIYITKLSEILQSGLILTIDYGFLYNELFSNERPEGTYRCFHKHTVNKNPYINIGNQDITADVDFSNIVLTGNKTGLKKLKYTTQGQFLVDWGILDIYENSLSKDKKGSYAIKNLFLPGMMGNYFKFLIQQKNIEKPEKLYPRSELNISFCIN